MTISELKKLHCTLSSDEQISLEVEKMLYSMFGNPGENTYFTFLDICSISDEVDVKGYQILVSANQLEELKNRVNKLNVNFNDIFTIIREHFHPYCIIKEEHHEGIAYKDNETWIVYYTEGSLLNVLTSNCNETYLFNVSPIEIANNDPYDYICKVFRTKVEDLIQKL
ncbi:MAG: hypothetical protein ACYDEJ_12370 [Desulfitobacteriaceae bacterium]